MSKNISDMVDELIQDMSALTEQINDESLDIRDVVRLSYDRECVEREIARLTGSVPVTTFDDIDWDVIDIDLELAQ